MHRLDQTVTYWVSRKTFNGMTFSAPVTIKARWETIQKLFKGPSGDEEMSNAQVMVESAVALGDYLLLGTSTVADPRDLKGAYEIRNYGEMTNLRNVTNERVAIL